MAAKLHTAMETCGFASVERYLAVAPYVYLFLFDIKETDSDRHQEYAGVPMEPIHESLFVLDQAGAKMILRCPIIPGLNDHEGDMIGNRAVYGVFFDSRQGPSKEFYRRIFICCQDFDEIVRQASELVISMLNGHPPPQNHH